MLVKVIGNNREIGPRDDKRSQESGYFESKIEKASKMHKLESWRIHVVFDKI